MRSSRLLTVFVRLHRGERAFDIVALLFLGYCVMGLQPWLPWFDRYPYPFLVTAVSLWAILLAMAVLTVVEVDHGPDA